MNLKLNTSQILFDSLKEVLKEKTFDKVTVNDIVKNCGASRATFYYHFKDKFELSCWEFDKYMQQITNKMSSDKTNLKSNTLHSLTYLEQNKKYYASLIKYDGQNSFYNTFLQIFLKNTSSYYKKLLGVTELSDSLKFSLEYNAAAHTYTIFQWLKSDCKIKKERLSELINLNYANNYPYNIVQNKTL